MNELTNPLQSLIRSAGKSLPAESGVTAELRRRMADAGTHVLALADTSSSMDEPAGGRRKIEILREALNTVLCERPEIRLFCFDSIAREVTAAAPLPEPSGGTALHLAIELAREFSPRQTVVISDGRPDDPEAAIAAAEKLSGTIDVIYCGPDSDTKAIDFMRRLAKVGCGRVIVRDLKKRVLGAVALSSDLRTVLALPAP